MAKVRLIDSTENLDLVRVLFVKEIKEALDTIVSSKIGTSAQVNLHATTLNFRLKSAPL